MMAWQLSAERAAAVRKAKRQGAMWRQIDYLADRKDRIQRCPGSRQRASFQGSRMSGGAAAPQEPSAVGFQPGPYNSDFAWAGHHCMGQINPFFRLGARPAAEQQTIAPVAVAHFR